MYSSRALYPTDDRGRYAIMPADQGPHIKRRSRYIEEVDFLREMWVTESRRHDQTKRELHRVQTLVDAADAAFNCMQGPHCVLPFSSTIFSDIARELVDKHLQQRAAQDIETRMTRHREVHSKLRHAARDALYQNQEFHRFAASFEHELHAFSDWLSQRASILQKNFTRLCEMMKETGGTEPELLYDEGDSLKEAEHAYVAASEARLQAMSMVMRVAYLEGSPDVFTDDQRLTPV